MANEQNNQTQNTSFEGTENQSSLGTTGSTGSTSSTSSTNQDTFSKTGDQSGSTGLSTETAKETARGIYDTAKSTAGQAYGVATKKATEVLEEKKGGLADGLTSVADSLRQVGGTLRENEDQTPIAGKAAEYGDTLAQQIEKISNYFERNDVRTMVRDVEGYARRNPAIFIGAAFAVGLLAARFLKSSPQYAASGSTGSYNTDRSFDNKLSNTGSTDLTTSESNLDLGGTTPATNL